jgi:hypothetical protein
LGTHFAWHLLNGLGLGLTWWAVALVPGGEQPRTKAAPASGATMRG